LRFAVLLLQVAAVFHLATAGFELEGAVFEKFVKIALGGFAIHYLLPARWRLGFFVLLSLGAIGYIFGPAQGAWFIALGLGLIGLCHLPGPFWVRAGAVTAAVALLAVLRANLLTAPWSSAIWPVFGSMFMLRLVIYLYDLKHKNAPASLLHGAAYFFMLPNVCFPLFPVVDYQTFVRTYTNDGDRALVVQSGVSWMVRGLVQLVLYRYVYQHLPIDTTSVTDAAQLLRYLAWPFLLYLQVSGLFHLVIGLLHLFGFNLPETHHLFYLASSYTEFWRRINIYWKDFMMKLFYYPAFFKLRKLGNNAALLIGTFWVFFATWVLHSYQWFWLRGSVLLKWSDTLFWTILAVLVAVNVVIEANRPMRRKLGQKTVPMRESLGRAVGALGVFVSICVLWSLWISDSVRDWLSLFSMAAKPNGRGLLVLGSLALFAIGFVGIALWYERRKPPRFTFWGSAARCGVTLCALLFVSWPDFYHRLDQPMADTIQKLRSPGLNSRDAARRQRDYYEKLNDVGWDNPELAKVFIQRPADWGSIRYRPDLAQLDNGLPYLNLLPNASGKHRGAMVSFNRWGMRGPDCEKEKPTGTYRIALLGASHTFASGVAREDGFGALLEERLNREGQLGPYDRVEVLNFSVEGYSPLDVLADLDQRVLDFHPDAICYVVHRLDAHGAAERLAKVVSASQPIPYPDLAEFAKSAGLVPGETEQQGMRLLGTKQVELLCWAYDQMAARCRARGVEPLAVLLPLLTPQSYDLDRELVLRSAEESGFHTIDLTGVYDGHDPEKLAIAPWDDHPNAEGHRLVADRLYKGIEANADRLWRAHAAIGDQGHDPRVRS